MPIFLGSIGSIILGFLILIFYKNWDYFRAMAVPLILGGWLILGLGFTNHLANKQLHRHVRSRREDH